MIKLPQINEVISIEYDASDADKTLIMGRVTGVQILESKTPAIQVAGVGWIYFDKNYSWKSVA